MHPRSLALGAFALLAAPFVVPVAADAQGFIGGAQNGYSAGDRALGPIGGVVGGAVGAGVGTVNGALGIHPRYRYYYVNHRRYRRRYYY